MNKYIITQIILICTCLSTLATEKQKYTLPLLGQVQLKGDITIKGLGEKSYIKDKTVKQKILCQFDEHATIFEHSFGLHPQFSKDNLFDFLNGMSISINAYFNHKTGRIWNQSIVSFRSYTGSEKEGFVSLVKSYSLPMGFKDKITFKCKSPDGVPIEITLSLYVADAAGEKVEFVKSN